MKVGQLFYPNGSPAAGARITLTDEASNLGRSTVSNCVRQAGSHGGRRSDGIRL
jgi:hypothetical protein